MKSIKTTIVTAIVENDDFDNWKNGKCKARLSKVLSKQLTNINNYDTSVIELEMSYDDKKSEDHNISILNDMYESYYMPKALNRYSNGEYSAHEKFTDGMFVTYKEFIKFVQYMQGTVVVHKLIDNLIGSFIMLQYIY